MENFAASLLFSLKNKKEHFFSIFYDSKSKGKNVDFLIHKGFDRPVPLEVGTGKKDKKQIFQTIKRYKSDWGIIVSNTTQFIKKEDNISYIPPKTFSFL